ncbi:MAG: hypothetical protein PHS98_01745 [Bacilli bacterium]|nr:hypothetical protein [Bacilli bacterium]MDD4643821.1 hypothetical protein [Bacilli bacterium]
MHRYTEKIDGQFVINDKHINSNDNGYYGDAVDKLAVFEDIIDDILLKQNEISQELKILRNEQQTKSYRFRQLLGQKLTNSALISIFESYKLM